MSQASIYLKIDGGAVKGDVTAENFKDLIAVTSFNFNANREISAMTGVMKERSAKAAYLGDISFSKLQDQATTTLLELATIGKAKQMEFHFTTQAEDGIKEICHVDLSDAMISSVSMDAGADARMYETYQVSYTKIQFKTTPFTDENAASAPLVFGYDGAQGKKM